MRKAGQSGFGTIASPGVFEMKFPPIVGHGQRLKRRGCDWLVIRHGTLAAMRDCHSAHLGLLGFRHRTAVYLMTFACGM